jgi:hypothetical protein
VFVLGVEFWVFWLDFVFSKSREKTEEYFPEEKQKN